MRKQNLSPRKFHRNAAPRVSVKSRISVWVQGEEERWWGANLSHFPIVRFHKLTIIQKWKYLSSSIRKSRNILPWKGEFFYWNQSENAGIVSTPMKLRNTAAKEHKWGPLFQLCILNIWKSQPYIFSESSTLPIWISQLFERGSRRNIKSHFGAFNLQWALLSNWNPWLKYLSTFHFLTKMAEIFCGVKVDAKASGNNFLRSLDSLEMLEND